MTDDYRISKAMAFGMAIVAAVTAIVSVHIGIAIGTSIKNYQNSPNVNVVVVERAVHPHLAKRQLTTIDDPQTILEYLRTKLTSIPAVSDMVVNIPTSIGELKGKDTDTGSLAEVRAASWLIHQDTVHAEEYVLTRFALAYIYYNNGGNEWNNTEKWLSTTESHCNWYGITCCKHFLFSPVCANTTADPDGITELDLYNNNLIGTIPLSIVLLIDLQSIFLSENWLTGTIPTGTKNIFQSLPKLLKVYLQHNTLTGTVPDIWNGLLDTFFVQGNNLNGTWPDTLCGDEEDESDLRLRNFGLDCEEIECANTCCDKWSSCYYHEPKVKSSS